MEPGIYYQDGSYKKLEIETGPEANPVFIQLQRIIGGYLERVTHILPKNFIMYVDEEALYKPNLQANKTFPQILGTVVVMLDNENEEDED